MDCSPSGSSVHGIFQARILESAAIFSSRGSPDAGIDCISLASPALTGGFFIAKLPGKPMLLVSSYEQNFTFADKQADKTWYIIITIAVCLALF